MNPFWMIKASFKKYKSISIAFILLIAFSTFFSTLIQLTERSFRQSSAQVSNKFDLVIGASGSKIDLLLSAAFFEQKQLKLMDVEKVHDILNDDLFSFAAPIVFGDHYNHLPIIGTSSAFVKDLSLNKIALGKFFDLEGEAVIGAKVLMHIGDEFTPNHGSFDLRLAKKMQAEKVQNDQHEHKNETPKNRIDVDKGHEKAENQKSHQDHREEENQKEVTQKEAEKQKSRSEKLDAHDHRAHHGNAFKIVGQLEATGTAWDYAIMVPVEAIWDMHGLEAKLENEENHEGHNHGAEEAMLGNFDHVQAAPIIIAKAKNIAKLYKARAKYDRDNLTAFFPAEIMSELYIILGDVQKITELVGQISQFLVVAAILVAIFILFKLFDHNFAILRAIGASQSYILMTILGYISFTILSASFLGLGLLSLTAKILARFIGEKMNFEISIDLIATDLLPIFYVFVLVLFMAFFLAIIGSQKSIVAQLSKH